MDLTPDEREELARLLGDDSLHAWAAFVTQVERGYDDSIYEYTNDLTVRDRLERVVQGASPGLQAKLHARLADDDARFEQATEDSARPLAADRPGWWWRRVPRRRSGELAEDLESLD
jgi:hypothetical protein